MFKIIYTSDLYMSPPSILPILPFLFAADAPGAGTTLPTLPILPPTLDGVAGSPRPRVPNPSATFDLPEPSGSGQQRWKSSDFLRPRITIRPGNEWLSNLPVHHLHFSGPNCFTVNGHDFDHRQVQSHRYACHFEKRSRVSPPPTCSLGQG